jgi:hypothetical protein
MLNKIAAFITTIPNSALILLLLGVIAGFAYTSEDLTRLVVMALGLGIAGGAVTAIPEVGGYVSAIFAGVATAVAGAIATRIVIRLYEIVMGDIKGLGA